MFFDPQRGFGFIKGEDSPQEYFAHYTQIQSNGYRELLAGEVVQFEVDTKTAGKSPQATHIVRFQDTDEGQRGRR